MLAAAMKLLVSRSAHGPWSRERGFGTMG
jgi:hypothetical protein